MGAPLPDDPRYQFPPRGPVPPGASSIVTVTLDEPYLAIYLTPCCYAPLLNPQNILNGVAPTVPVTVP